MSDLFIPSKEDYIDTSLLSKLTFSPIIGWTAQPMDKKTFQLTLQEEENLGISFTLKEINDDVIVRAIVTNQKLVTTFQEVLEKGITLEETKYYQESLAHLQSQLKDFYQQNSNYLFYDEQTLLLQEGIGVIYDKETQVALGSFEELSVIAQDDRLSFVAKNCRLANDKDHTFRNYYYTFYSLWDELAYRLEPNAYSYDYDRTKETLSFKKGSATVLPFSQNKMDIQIVKAIQQQKELLTRTTEEDPLYLEIKETYHQLLSRLTNQAETIQRKQQVASQFEDIDF